MRRALVAIFVLVKVELVVVFSVPENLSLLNLGNNLFVDRVVPFLLKLVIDLVGNLVLFIAVSEDSTSVLGAKVIGTLLVNGSRVMDSEKKSTRSAYETILGSYDICKTSACCVVFVQTCL